MLYSGVAIQPITIAYCFDRPLAVSRVQWLSLTCRSAANLSRKRRDKSISILFVMLHVQAHGLITSVQCPPAVRTC